MYNAILVDDESLILETLCYFVDWGKYGIVVVNTFQNAQSALEYIKTNKCHIIIVDVRMPVMDGIAMSSEARAAGCEAQIVFLSGYDDFSYVKSALKVNACDYLLKPVDFDELHNTLLKVVNNLKQSENPDAPDDFFEGFEIQNVSDSIMKTLDKGFGRLFFSAISKNDAAGLQSLCHQFFSYHAIKKSTRDTVINEISKVFLELANDYMPYSVYPVPPVSKLISIKTALEMEAYVGQYLSSINNEFNKPVPEPKIQLVNQMIKLMQENYDSIHTVEDLARKLYISPSYVRDLLKRYTGKTFVEYLTEIRINAAIELLKNSNIKIKYIADKVGYKTESYFSSLFEEYKGLTPYEYRKKYFSN